MRSPRHYGLTLNHKHLPEMVKVNGLKNPPLFAPVINNIYSGMTVSIPLHISALSKHVAAADIHAVYSSHYENQRYIKVMPLNASDYIPDGFLDATTLNNTNELQICIFGSSEHLLLAARFDNLGKGASGAAVQNMEIMLGL